MTLFGEFIRIVEGLYRRKISYAVIGGLAVSYHDRVRGTEDIDFLILAQDVQNVRELLNSLGYVIEATPWTFKNTGMTMHRFNRFEGEEHMMIDIMTSNDPQYTAMLDRVVVADTAAGPVSFASKEDLIFLKKQRNSPQDKVDIAALQNDQSRTSDLPGE